MAGRVDQARERERKRGQMRFGTQGGSWGEGERGCAAMGVQASSLRCEVGCDQRERGWMRSETLSEPHHQHDGRWQQGV
eukprot:1424757-Rhodomonas_salina.1